MSEALVVDAGVAVKWFVLEANTDRALALLEQPIEFFVPSLALLEVARAFQKKEEEGALPRDFIGGAMKDLRTYFRRIFPLEDLVDDALEITRKVRHPIYDCVYLALAIRLGCQLVTADSKFADKFAATPYAPHIIHLADWRA